MSKYTFTFKKDDVFVEFFTADKDVVERQFQIWVSDADDYVNNRPRRSSEALASEQPQQKQNDSESVTPKEENTSQPEASIEPDPEPITTENTNAEVATEVTEVAETPSQPQTEVFDQASTLLKTINTIQEGNDSNEKEQPSEIVDFDNVLEKTLENPTFEPNRPRDQIYLNLIMSKKTADKFHYLMITAYYLSEFEKLERFSIKQINAKLMQNLSEVVDHTTLQEAINQNLIELVPDLTGTSEVGEYRLTPLGEDFFAKI